MSIIVTKSNDNVVIYKNAQQYVRIRLVEGHRAVRGGPSPPGGDGQHTAIMNQYDVIVLAPQVRSYYEDMKADTDRLGIKLLAPRGQEYIKLTRDPEGAIKWLRQNMAE